jgi:hypothetical protein
MLEYKPLEYSVVEPVVADVMQAFAHSGHVTPRVSPRTKWLDKFNQGAVSDRVETEAGMLAGILDRPHMS